MKQRKMIVSLVTLISCATLLGACTNPRTWNKTERGVAIGGTGGALLGGVVGSQVGSTTGGAILGGAAGAGAGALIGNEFDRNNRRGRERY